METNNDKWYERLAKTAKNTHNRLVETAKNAPKKVLAASLATVVAGYLYLAPRFELETEMTCSAPESHIDFDYVVVPTPTYVEVEHIPCKLPNYNVRPYAVSIRIPGNEPEIALYDDILRQIFNDKEFKKNQQVVYQVGIYERSYTAGKHNLFEEYCRISNEQHVGGSSIDSTRKADIGSEKTATSPPEMTTRNIKRDARIFARYCLDNVVDVELVEPDMFGIAYATVDRRAAHARGFVDERAMKHAYTDIACTALFVRFATHYTASVAAQYALNGDDRIYRKAKALQKHRVLDPGDWEKFDSLYKHYLAKHRAKLKQCDSKPGEEPITLHSGSYASLKL